MNRINVLQRLVIIAGIIMCWPRRAEPFKFARTEKIFPGHPASEMPSKSKDGGGWLVGTGNMYQPGLDAKHGNWWTGNVDKNGNPLPTHEEIAQAKFSANIPETNHDGSRNEALLSLLSNLRK